ncbi:DEAD-box ATP-dependent RNA helicase 20-like [Pyrus ussuriensis x Pyrus communis]|uniref:DEAD-box ATP-dependent RNA helicase 20-like n=1 Tax=Pyrus ussuriensis x Pyrus communis TaxID=2448454 RepID=A0A5N5G6Z6_9ROSA|nr:DEAD-box ATP-dependent RNA helicase 20-like [Pyrus ussuriensis x Pyrus communis]
MFHIMQIRSDRQTLYWSATWPKEVEQLARHSHCIYHHLDMPTTNLHFLDVEQVIIGSPDLKANHSISQIVDIITENQKYNKLVTLLEDIIDGSRILIFMDTKKGCDQITRQLHHSAAPHGWMACSFDSCWQEPIMTATDVAARGLDVKDVKFVINYDFPGSLEDYVHRTAYTFFTAANARFAKELIALLEEAGQKVSPELGAMGRGAPPPPSGHGGFRDRGRGYGGGRPWN